jgi:hypothetical protein
MGLARAQQGLERPEATLAAIGKRRPGDRRHGARASVHRCAPAGSSAGCPPSEEKELHAAYKSALDSALALYPDDAELWILRGNAEEPGPWGRGQFGGVASIAFYETALVRAPDHFGAHHYMVHSFENIGQHAEAAGHGKIYAESSPDVAHAQHMYDHVLPRLGRWKEALAQFEKADAIEEAYAKAESLRPGDDWHHLHNLQLLGYTYLRLGRFQDAEATFRRAFETPARLPYRGTPQASLAEFYLLRGRPEEALAIARALRVPAGRSPRGGGNRRRGGIARTGPFRARSVLREPRPRSRRVGASFRRDTSTSCSPAVAPGRSSTAGPGQSRGSFLRRWPTSFEQSPF